MRTRVKHLYGAVLVLAFVVPVVAQQQGARPSVERLRAHITYLASDKLEGRRTGSAGAKLAAEYIAREFARYGLRRSIGVDLPGMSILEADSPRRYLQEFPYVASVELGKGNVLESGKNPFAGKNLVRGLAFRIGEDWMPLGFSSSGSVENAQVAFVGYGITASELKYDDYQGVDVKNKVVFAFSGTPDGDNPHGQFARHEDTRWKAIAARNAGAKALVIIAQEENFKEDRLSRLRYDNSGGEAGLPVLVISRQAAARFFHIDGRKLSTLELALKDAAQRSMKAGVTDTNLPVPYILDIHEANLGEDVRLTVSTDIIRREVPATNVVGVLPGSDPKLKDETIVIGAHYDHLGRGGEGSLAPREGDIHHGADDNASGVAGLLELARIFSAQQPRPKRTLVFIAFSGEEEGLLGSSFYVNHPIMPLARTVAMINMDMIGRLKDGKLIVGGAGTAPEWRSLIDRANLIEDVVVTTPGKAPVRQTQKQTIRLKAGVPLTISRESGKLFELTLNEDGYGPSDHSSFYAKQVPVLFLWTGTHDDYHKPSDTADKINYEGETRIVAFVAQIVQDIDKNDQRPTYTLAKSESTGRSMGFRVYLGTIPNYADSNDGLKLDGVRDDSPAAKAGLKAGDRIVRLAGREVKNVYDYTYALGEMKAGQEYEVEVIRGSEHLTLKITPAARK